MNKVNVGLPAVNADSDFAVITGKSDIFQYEGGKKVSETRIGVKLNLALQGARYAQLSVKFDHDPLPNVTDEQIERACVDCTPLYVQISDCVVSLYSSNSGGIGMTATATTAKLVTLKNDK